MRKRSALFIKNGLDKGQCVSRRISVISPARRSMRVEMTTRKGLTNMRIIAITFCVFATATFASGQAVRLFNATAAYTPLEVGQQAQVVISGAAPSAPVVMNLNGVNYSMGNTD